MREPGISTVDVRASENCRFGNLLKTLFGSQARGHSRTTEEAKSVEDLVRELWAKTFTNRRRSKVKVVVPKSPGLECELVADL
jgi:hypothetical protein